MFQKAYSPPALRLHPRRQFFAESSAFPVAEQLLIGASVQNEVCVYQTRDSKVLLQIQQAPVRRSVQVAIFLVLGVFISGSKAISLSPK